MHKIVRSLIGLALIAMGLVVIAGWLLHIPLMVQFKLGFVPMVFNTALCFLVTGIALSLPAFEGPAAYRASMRRLISLLGAFLVALCSISFLEILLDTGLGIDWPNLHIWIGDGNTRPGRMAPNTALGFITIGLALLVIPRVASRWQARLARFLTVTVLAIGLTGLVGYLLAPDLLYGWARSARMAVHTATGMMLAGVALWLSWSHADWYRSRRYLDEENKIAFLSAAMLVVLTITAGLVGFVSQQAVLQQALQKQLATEFSARTALFRRAVDDQVALAARLAKSDYVLGLVERKDVGPDAPAEFSDQSRVAVAMVEPDGTSAYSLGSFSPDSEFQVPLVTAVPAVLIWQGGLRLRTSTPVSNKDRVIGTLVLEFSLDSLYQRLYNARSLGETGEIVLCVRDSQKLICLPPALNRGPVHINPFSKYGKPLPMKLALDGEAGLMEAVDYRGHNVMAAFDRLAPGLGMVTKLDTVELYAGIRQQLKTLFPLLVVLSILGAYVMRAQLKPLARRLIVSEAVAADKEQQISTLLNSVNEGILTVTEAGIITSFNPAASRIFGYPAGDIIGQGLDILFPAGGQQVGIIQLYFEDTPRLGDSLELPGMRSDGSLFQLELSVNEMQVNGHRLLVGIIRDITERKRAEQELYAEKERLRVTLSSIGDAVITTDIHGCVNYLNPIAESMTGWTTEEAEGHSVAQVFEIINDRTGKPAFNPVETVLRTRTVSALEADTTLIQRNTGLHFPIEDSAAPIRGRDGEVTGVVLVFHDVTEARKMAAEMTYQATHDSLTGLINRREFERRVESALQTGKVQHKEHSLLYLDLDQFKIVNDTCGHVAGDELLRQLTSVLQAKLRQTDTLGRLGGDEFGVLLEGCPIQVAVKISEELRRTVTDFHFVWKDKHFTVGVTIGVVGFSNDGITLTDVLQMADSACYVAKEKGRNRVQVYSPEEQEFASRHGQMGWVGRIHKALEENRFLLYSQQYRALGVNTAQVTHRELLIRMRDEDGALVPPMAFIPAAERYGLMPLLDRWVVATAFSRYASISEGLTGQQILAINLSGTTLCDETFADFLQEQFLKFDVSPRNICFEITETAAIANLTQAIKLIQDLRAMGCLFALDDFGSGMSSFGYLKHLPVNFLKIDGNFVRDMVDDPIDRAMVESINHIGHVMGIKTIAEFVENEQILELLTGMGVDFAQGYTVEIPRPFDELKLPVEEK